MTRGPAPAVKLIVYDIVADPPAWWAGIRARWLAKPWRTRGSLDQFARQCADLQCVRLPPRPLGRAVMLLQRPIPAPDQARLRKVQAQINNVKAKIQDKGKDTSKGKGKGVDYNIQEESTLP